MSPITYIFICHPNSVIYNTFSPYSSSDRPNEFLFAVLCVEKPFKNLFLQINFQSTSEKDDDSIEQPLSSSLRPASSVAKPSVTDMSEFTDATITADEFSEEVLKYPRNIGVDGALTSEWKNQNILGDFEVRF